MGHEELQICPDHYYGLIRLSPFKTQESESCSNGSRIIFVLAGDPHRSQVRGPFHYALLKAFNLSATHKP